MAKDLKVSFSFKNYWVGIFLVSLKLLNKLPLRECLSQRHCKILHKWTQTRTSLKFLAAVRSHTGAQTCTCFTLAASQWNHLSSWRQSGEHLGSSSLPDASHHGEMFCISGNVLCLYSQYVSHLVICGYQTLEIRLQQVKNGT